MSWICSARIAIVFLGLASNVAVLAEGIIAPKPEGATEANPSPYVTTLRIVVVHWKIKPGREAEFLDYWSTRSVVEDRSGLVSEYLSSVEDRDHAPWIIWQTLSPSYTSYFNVGIWRNLNAFQDQIGRRIDNSRPSMPFEAERRERVLLVPELWRTGRSALPATDPPSVR